MKKEKYNLTKSLYDLFLNKETQNRKVIYDELLLNTGITEDELWEMSTKNQTVGNLKYRILGLMDKKKISSTHII